MINIKVAELMGKHKLTKKALSEITGIRPNTISALWHGTIKRLEIEQIDRLCAALNCQPGDIMEYVPDNIDG
ncbi:MAG: putative transcriptional regulator YozG, Cro/CI family [Firmicutes bacterium]|nr:putative transcriptional regulator YozG, Cro/CI family [Bacillota bacterium]